MNASHVAVCSPAADAAFGPAVHGCRDDFDFTLAFEQYFFSIAPSALLILIAPLRLRQLFGKPARVKGDRFRTLKLSLLLSFAAVQLSLVVLWAIHHDARARGPSVAAAVLSFTSSIVLCLISPLEHSRSLRPSLLLNAYLLISLLFDAVVLRTLWLSAFNDAIRNVFTASFALKATVLFQEAWEKRKFLQAADKDQGPEATSGLYSQGLFWWVNDIIRRGFRQILQPDDLYPIDEALEAEFVDSKFWQAWNTSTWQGKHKLEVAVFQALKWPILRPVAPRIVKIGFTFCQPLLVSRFLDYLQSEDQSVNIGHGLIGAYAVVYFGIAITTGFYEHQTMRSLTMMRGVLISAIFKRTTELSVTAIDNKAAVTLMSTDVQRIIRSLREAHDLWANVIEVCLATYLLERQVGYACVGPIIVVAVSASLTFYFSSKARETQGQWMKQIQKRIGITSSALGSMKGVKMLGLTHKLEQVIQKLRVDEVHSAGSFRLIGVYTSSLAFIPQLIAPVVTFAIFAIIAAKDHTALDPTKMFTSLSLLLLMCQPMFSMFESVVDFMSMLGCFERIEKFLRAEHRLDYRLLMDNSRPSTTLSERPSLPIGATSSDVELVALPTIQGAVRPDQQSNAEVIVVRDASFGWKADSEPLLQDINLSIKKAQLTLVVGAVASGKSTLLKALLGEVPNSKGFVYVSDFGIAFCEQTPWLINATLQRNIIGFTHVDQSRYDAIVHACDLDSDIEMMPNGHDTLLGSKEFILTSSSALARALYTRKEMAIFDDVFSGLDKTTSKKVFDRVFGSRGLLRSWRTTAILATHSVSLMPMADHIVALGDNGTIVEQGTFQQLDSQDGYVHSFFLERLKDEDAKDEEDLARATAKQQEPRKPTAPPTSKSTNKKRQTGDFATYRFFFDTVGLPQTLFFLFLEFCWAFFFTFPTVWLEWWTDVNTSNEDHRTGYYLGVYASYQVAGLLAAAAVVYYSLNVMAANTGIKLHATTLKAVMSAPLSFFTKTDVGSLINRFSQDMQLLDHSLPLSLMVVVNTLMLCVGQAILIATASAYIAISFPFLIAAYYAVQRYYLRTSRQLRLLDLEEKAPVVTQFLETLSGLVSIRAFGWQKQSISQNHALLDRSQRPFYLLFMVQRWLTLVLDLMNTALAVIVVTIAVKFKGSVSVGFTGVSLTQIISFTSTMKLMILFWTQLENSLGAVTRIKDFKQETENEYNSDGELIVSTDWPSTGSIEIRDLCASYEKPTVNDDSANTVLDNINLEIKPGQRIGICGRTGSGKSSLILTLLRLLDPLSGSILIDGIDISTVPREHVRRKLNVLSQEPFFLHGSIRLNLDPYETQLHPHNADTMVDHDKILTSALQEVGLATTLLSEAGGLDQPFDPEASLSHGQRQLFCLARSLVRAYTSTTSKILILDEATSSVDRETEKTMERVIAEEFKGWTVVAIAHRLETLMDFDEVVVMDRGRVVESGPPEKLRGMKGGAFAKLWDGERGATTATVGGK